MCLTIPKKVLEIKENSVVVEKPDGTRQEIKSIIKLKAGDFCLTQQNIVIQKIGKREAREILKLINLHTN